MRVPFYACVALLLAGTSVTGQPVEYRCNYINRFECDAAGCAKVPVGASYLLVPDLDYLITATIRAETNAELPAIRRCDLKGCSPVTVRASPNGIFVNIVQPDGAYFLKIAIDSVVDKEPKVGDFIEVASLFLSTITYTGNCVIKARR